MTRNDVLEIADYYQYNYHVQFNVGEFKIDDDQSEFYIDVVDLDVQISVKFFSWDNYSRVFHKTGDAVRFVKTWGRK